MTSIKLFPDSQRRKSKEHKLKHLLKTKASFIICLHSAGNHSLLEQLSPFDTSQIHGTNIFFFKKGLPTLISWGHLHFLYLIYFQTGCNLRIVFQL